MGASKTNPVWFSEINDATRNKHQPHEVGSSLAIHPSIHPSDLHLTIRRLWHSTTTPCFAPCETVKLKPWQLVAKAHGTEIKRTSNSTRAFYVFASITRFNYATDFNSCSRIMEWHSDWLAQPLRCCLFYLYTDNTTLHPVCLSV